MGRDANPPLAHAHDNIFLSQPLIKLGSFFRGRRGEATVRPALCAVQRTGRNAVFGKAFEQELDQFPVVFEHELRPNAQHKIHRGVHGRQVEIEISGPLPPRPNGPHCGMVWDRQNSTQKNCLCPGPSNKTALDAQYPDVRSWPKKILCPRGSRSHLYPAHTKKSAPSSFTSIGTAPQDWLTSSTSIAPCA